MATYVALLRAVNVSGKNVIPMAALRSAAAAIGLVDPETYLQSGNLIFDAKRKGGAALEKAIRQMIADTFGHDVDVFVLSAEEITEITESHAFPDLCDPDLSRLFAMVLAAPVSDALWRSITPPAKKNESVVRRGRVIFFHCPDGAADTKLTNAYFEKALGVRGTCRNWRTMLALREDPRVRAATGRS